MKGTAYVNARVSSNGSGSPNEQKAQVLAEIAEFADYRKRLVQILRPEIIICAGTSAKDAIFQKGGVFEPTALSGDAVFRHGQSVVVITSHLSRPPLFGGYEGLHELACKCSALHLASPQSTLNAQPPVRHSAFGEGGSTSGATSR
jgi:hypothetical protein